MLRQTLRSLAAHKRRFLATATAVVLGVAFMSGTLVLTNTMTSTFDGLFADIHRDTDAYVRSANDIDGTRDRIPADTVADVAAIDGVADAVAVIEGYAQVVGPDGKALEPAGGSPALGVSWMGDSNLNPYDIDEGRAPDSADEIVIDRRTADLTGYQPGDAIEVVSQAGVSEFRVVGVTTFAGAETAAGASVVGFDPAAAARHLGAPGVIDAVAASASAGVDQKLLRARITDELPDIEVLTGEAITEERQEKVREGIGMLSTFLLGFALISLFVGAFIIHNTFSIVVAQRTRELALLRALGASRSQVMGSVIGEAAGVGIVASAVGLVAGLGIAEGLQALLASSGLELSAGSVITPGSLVGPLVVGAAVCVMSAISPARRAATIAPVKALREGAAETGRPSKRRTVAGLALVAVGSALAAAGVVGSTAGAIALGFLVLLVGTKVLAPTLAVPASRVLGAPAALLRGVTGRLARENAARNPKRTAATASALMIGVTLVGFATIVASSTKAAVDTAVSDAVQADLILTSGTFSPGISPAVAEQISDVDGVDAVTPIRFGPATINGDATTLLAYDPASAEVLMDLDVTAGRLADLGEDGIAVQRDAADESDWSIGDVVAVGLPTGPTDLRVAAIYDEQFASGSYVIGIDRFAASYPLDLDQNVLIGLDASSKSEARRAVEALVADQPTVQVMNQQEYSDAQAGQIDQFLGLIYALLALAVLIAFIGIVNTLGLSIHERTRELGLLRAVGMTRRQIRAAVRWEAVIIAAFGTALGLALGTGLGTAAVSALGDSGIERIVVPSAQLATIGLLGGAAGVLAAVLPARRAARLDVLTALRAT